MLLIDGAPPFVLDGHQHEREQPGAPESKAISADRLREVANSIFQSAVSFPREADSHRPASGGSKSARYHPTGGSE